MLKKKKNKIYIIHKRNVTKRSNKLCVINYMSCVHIVQMHIAAPLEREFLFKTSLITYLFFLNNILILRQTNHSPSKGVNFPLLSIYDKNKKNNLKLRYNDQL